MTNMKFTYFFILVFIANIKCFAADPLIPSVVEKFYDSMKLLATETSASKAYELQKIMQYCFLYGKPDEKHNVNSGIEVPNDFYDLGYANNKRMSSTLYTQIFKNMAFSEGERLRVQNITYKSSSYAHEIDLIEFRKEESPYIRTFVTRTFILGEKRIIFNDTVMTRNNIIYSFRNDGIGNDEGGDDIETLRALAAQYTSAKQYKKAFKIYEKIISIDKNNANAYYRLGIFAFWYGKKCGFNSTTVSKKKGKEYMREAMYQRALHADRVLYYMKHSASI